MEEFGSIKKRLEAGGIENADIQARLLCEHFSGEALSVAAQRVLSHEPIQYVLGEWGFYREVYEVNEHCLIPRPDTEHLVEKAVQMLPNGARFLDLCTGSGCVAISTLAAREDVSAVAVELFPETLELAARNAARNGVERRISFLRADVLTPPPPFLKSFDAILSNPPYINKKDMQALAPEVRREPHAALYGGEDGLMFYRAILRHWRVLLKPHGVILLEIGYDQAEPLRALAAEHGFCATVYRDYGGNDRVAVLQK